MMQANELRIGNIVTINNEKYHHKMKDIPLIVSGINECKRINNDEWTYSINLIYPNNEKNIIIPSFSQFIKFIQPIILTEDWLLKLGFELRYEGSNLYDFIDFDKKTIDCLNRGQGFLCLADFIDNKKVKGYLDLQTRVVIKYVHQLQNLYFVLTGKELVINELVNNAK